MSNKSFQILALSGGGFRGLYTASILADIEQKIGKPIGTCFDLIAGTSIGGIISLAVANEIPMKQIVDLFENNGEKIFKERWSFGAYFRSKYSSGGLKKSLQDVFGDKKIEDCKHPVIIPSINYGVGKVLVFKTPHHQRFYNDYKYSLVDVGLATSAAPTYFPRHRFDRNDCVDGGLYANAPGIMAMHEVKNFLGWVPVIKGHDLYRIHYKDNSSHPVVTRREITNESIRVLSIGTMSSKFTGNPKRYRGGLYDWGGLSPLRSVQQLFGLSISIQENLTNFMLEHLLGERYVLLDDVPDSKELKFIGLDKTNKHAQEILLRYAKSRAKNFLGEDKSRNILNHVASSPIWFHGTNKNVEGEQPC
jgi:patatin-like phospholipase/acyl hydrolase